MESIPDGRSRIHGEFPGGAPRSKKDNEDRRRLGECTLYANAQDMVVNSPAPNERRASGSSPQINPRYVE